jgi:putative transposase
LSWQEKAKVHAVLNSERFQDMPAREVYATLLDEDGVYLCHWRTMYRVEAEYADAPEPPKRRRHAKRVKPQLCASGPNQVWSWDITQLKGPGQVYYLYTIIDVYSRYIVGWLIAPHERGQLAVQLLTETCRKEGIRAQQLTLHSDRGSPMRAKTFRDLLAALEITPSHSRPHTPTDNAYSEAQFRTLKYCPSYPGKFGRIREAREWVRRFVAWYNHVHHHTGLQLLTPASVHHGQEVQILAHRQRVLDAVYAAHPERFVAQPPTAAAPPAEVWINQPEDNTLTPTPFSGAVTTATKPGAQPGSRAQSAASLDAGEHLATIGGSLPRQLAETDIFPPKLEAELSQSH